MPWTPAHPAFAIPFLKIFRRPFPAVCLVIGSMAPDLPYFFLVRFVGWSHAFPMGYLVGIPLTVILAHVWLYYLSPTFFAVLPIVYGAPQNPGKVRGDFITGCMAAAVGIATHVFVDGFTHANGYIVRQWPLLQVRWEVFGKTVPVWHFLQLFFTVVGLGGIALYFFLSPHWKIARSRWASPYAKIFWIKSALFSLIAGLVIFFFRWPFSSLAIVSVAIMTSVTVGMVAAFFLIKQDL